MNEDRIIGAARNFGGKLQEGIGRATGDVRQQAEGVMGQAAGAAQEFYGKASESASEAGDIIRRGAADLGDYFIESIRQRPYATAAIIFGIGWLVGRVGRR